MKTFDELFKAYDWRPIRNCPGRYVLCGPLSEADISGEAHAFTEHSVAAARDTVLVMKLRDGAGLISYRRADGSLLHTLNTPEGFERKLLQLGIVF